MVTVWNCRKAAMLTPPATARGPMYGMTLRTPATSPQDRWLRQSSRPQREPGRNGDDNADDRSHEQVRTDLRADVVQNLQRDLFLGEPRARDFNQMTPEQVAREQKIERQKGDHHGIRDRASDGRRTSPHIIGHVEGLRFNFHFADFLGGRFR
jgi:hypothetical protein